MKASSPRLWAALVVVLPLLATSRNAPATASPAPHSIIEIAPKEPDDVRGGAEHATLQMAAEYAWQEFIAMNWPAAEGVRDTPDPKAKFGEPARPVVWETFRSKVEIYPGDGSATKGPHGWDSGQPDYGYDQGPQYIYSAEVPACDDATASQKTAWVNLDETSQVGFDFMHAGVAGGALIHYLAKANRSHYDYVVKNNFWYGFLTPGTPANTAYANFTKAVSADAFPPAAPYVTFPSGTIEVKAAFRPLTKNEMSGGRFYTTPVRYYKLGKGGRVCYAQETWGLLALHVIHKTPTAPAYTWATFEQADNLQTTVNGKAVSVEDDDGKVRHPGPTTTPALHYKDGFYRPGKAPLVSKEGPFCADPGPRLYYREIAVDSQGRPYENTPSGGDICVGERTRSIPATVVSVNHNAHLAIARYEAVNHLQPSPWRHYKLVNVQTYPFDKSQLAANPDSAHGAPSFYTSNIVVETDYTLQNHSGGPETHTGAAPSDISVNFASSSPPLGQPPPLPVYKNTYILHDGKVKTRYNMGGCMGCHGLTQIVGGSDFSYILFESSVMTPEYEGTPAQSLTPKYLGRFASQH